MAPLATFFHASCGYVPFTVLSRCVRGDRMGVVDRCGECGFVYDEVRADALAEALRDHAGRYREPLSSATALHQGTVRPEPAVWSALEYACHVRDVLFAQRERALLALVVDNPDFTPMYRDERVALAGYGRQSIDDAAAQLVVGANLLAIVFDGLSDSQLSRPCIYNYPTPSQRDVTWLGRHTVHELVHHLVDVRSVLRRVAAD
jgi:DinB superfamily